MKHIVCEIKLYDSDDPDIYVAGPIYDWQRTEAGKWVMKHSKPEPRWVRTIDVNTLGYTYIICAELTPEQITYFELKYK